MVIFCGGTFSMKIDETTGSAVPHFHGKDLLKLIPEANDLANISLHEFGLYPGPHMTPELDRKSVV